MTDTLIETLDALPLIAILRGLRPDEAIDIGEAIVEAGFRCLEVPLNSPEPLESIRRLRDALGDRAIVGAGTVLTPDAVRQVADAGGQLIVSPNADATVIAASVAQGLLSLPGVFTPTEAFQAIAAGAHGLKLFPAEMAGPKGLKALRAVLPAAQRLYAVGGVEPGTMSEWRSAGASGFGIGSAIFKPGKDAATTHASAAAFVSAWTAGPT